jgi:glucosamine kinase
MNPHVRGDYTQARAGVPQFLLQFTRAKLRSQRAALRAIPPFLVYSVYMKFVLGFDGGGTKTDCVLLSEEGKMVAQSRSGPSNPYRIGVEAAARAVVEAADNALLEAKLDRTAISGIGAGLAGTGDAGRRDAMREALQIKFPRAKVVVFTDMEASLFAAGEGPVIVLLAGTGSFAIGRDSNGQIWRSGGLGFRISDEGSAFDIGQRAVIQSKKIFQKQGSNSGLGKQILERLNFSSWEELQSKAESAPDDIFPRVFPVVAAAADENDLNAQEILRHAAGQLAELAKSVADHFGGRSSELTLVKTGGAIGRSIFLDAQLDAVLQRVLPKARMGSLKMSPAEAAARAVLS